jgi:hypothetical protein
MSDYSRLTATPVREVLELAGRILPERAGLAPAGESRHGATYRGAEGTVVIEAHRHGPQTEVIVRTDQLRTSKADNAVRYLLNQFPYQPGDPARD